MHDFNIRVRDQTMTFQFGVHFVEGESRLCWTLAGIEKLIAAGLWRREFDWQGKLRSKTHFRRGFDAKGRRESGCLDDAALRERRVELGAEFWQIKPGSNFGVRAGSVIAYQPRHRGVGVEVGCRRLEGDYQHPL